MVFYERNCDDIDRGIVGLWKLDDLKRVADSLTAHFKMNDNAATTVIIDSKLRNAGVASANTSTLTGAGKLTTALALNGTDEYLKLGAGDNLNPGASSFSIAFWINLTDDGALQMILGKYADASYANNSGGVGFELLYRGDSGSKPLHFRVNNGTGEGTTTRSDALGYSDISGGWHHIVLVSDRENGKGIIYVDGANVVLNDFDDISSQTGTYSNAGNFHVGRQSGDGSGGWMTGSVDDLRFYKRVLTAANVATIYNTGTGTESTDLFKTNPSALDRITPIDGTITGASNVTGKNLLNNDAMFFDGIDDKVDIAHNTNQLLTAGFSISCTLKPSATPAYPTFLDKSSANFGADGFLFLGDRAADQVMFRVNQGTQVRSGAIVFAGDGNFYNVVVTVSAAAVVSFYINGALSGTPASTAALSGITTTENLTIGGLTQGGNPFEGVMQNMKLYNRVLTPGEASKISRLNK